MSTTPPVPASELLLLSEVSELTRVPVGTLRYWRSMKRGPRTFRLGGKIVCKRQDVVDWIEQQYADDAPEAETA